MALPKGVLIHPDELGELWISRLKNSGIKVLGLHPVGGKRAHESLEAMRQGVQAHRFDRAFAALAEMGIQLEYEMHAMSWLLPRDLFAVHSDWFRMNEAGERVADFNCCPSCAEALDFIAHRAAELSMVLRPTTHRYYYWIDDVRNSFCHCPACRGLTPSDQAMLIYNAILKGVRTVDAAATHCYLAYQLTERAPVSVKPQNGIFLEYAPFDRDFHRPLGDQACERNQKEADCLPDLLATFGKRNAKVLEYWLDNSLFSKWKKPPMAFLPDEAVLRADLRFYEELGFSDCTTFACYLGADYEALHGAPDISVYLNE